MKCIFGFFQSKIHTYWLLKKKTHEPSLENTVIKDFLQLNLILSDTLEGWIIYCVLKLDCKNAKSYYVSYPFDFLRHALTLKILMDKDSFCFVFIALICIAILKLVDMICDQRTSWQPYLLFANLEHARLCGLKLKSQILKSKNSQNCFK